MNRRQLLTAAAVTATTFDLSMAAAEAAPGDAFTDHFTISRGHWVDVGGVWSLQHGTLQTRSARTDRTMHSVRTRSTYEGIWLIARIRHVGAGSVSLITNGAAGHRSAAGEWGPSYRFGYTASGKVFIVRINPDFTRTVLLAPETDDAVDPGAGTRSRSCRSTATSRFRSTTGASTSPSTPMCRLAMPASPAGERDR